MTMMKIPPPFNYHSNCIDNNNKQNISQIRKRLINQEMTSYLIDGTSNYLSPYSLLTSTSTNDVYNFGEMLKQDDKEMFHKAMEDEINKHTASKNWKLVEIKDVPQNTKIIQSIWTFKRKRFPDGRVQKHRARLCAHGGQQQWGINYWETYAPVVNWMSIRTLLVISLKQNLHTRCIDFVLAFPQAPLDEEVYMYQPPGCSKDKDGKKYVLKLINSLYGLKQAGHNWFEKLEKALKNRKFIPSTIDPCVFFRSDIVVIIYVDDCILFSKEPNVADELIQSLCTGQENFKFEDLGTLQNYLGVQIIKGENGESTLTQPHLTQRFLDLVQTETDKRKISTKLTTPSKKPVLHKDTTGPERRFDWNYRTAIGMLGYLQAITRPDISMASHQCARFVANPKLSHERAVKRIAKYLRQTKLLGLIMTPKPSKGIECYVDADFAGGWRPEDPTDNRNLLSRAGFIIMFCGCAIIWVSKLESVIALSTAESEYIALSMAMRQVLPMIEFMKEVNVYFKIEDLPSPKVYCRVFEDNESCISIATNNRFSPRTKYIALKYHHFRGHVKDGTIKIQHVSTEDQLADMLTKPLELSSLARNRKGIMGW
jgi:hypothetical protein